MASRTIHTEEQKTKNINPAGAEEPQKNFMSVPDRGRQEKYH